MYRIGRVYAVHAMRPKILRLIQQYTVVCNIVKPVEMCGRLRYTVVVCNQLLTSYLFICDVSFAIGKLHQASGQVVTILWWPKDGREYVSNDRPLRLYSHIFLVSWSRRIRSLVLYCGAFKSLSNISAPVRLTASVLGDVVRDSRSVHPQVNFLSALAWTFLLTVILCPCIWEVGTRCGRS